MDPTEQGPLEAGVLTLFPAFGDHSTLSAHIHLFLKPSFYDVLSENSRRITGCAESTHAASLTITVCYFFVFTRRAIYVGLLKELNHLPPVTKSVGD